MPKAFVKDGKAFVKGRKMVLGDCCCDRAQPEPCGACTPPCALLPVGHPLSCASESGDPCEFVPFQPNCCNGFRAATSGQDAYVFFFAKLQERRTQVNGQFAGSYTENAFDSQSFYQQDGDLGWQQNCELIGASAVGVGTQTTFNSFTGSTSETPALLPLGASADIDGFTTSLQVTNVQAVLGGVLGDLGILRSLCFNPDGTITVNPDAEGQIDFEAGFSSGLAWATIRGAGSFTIGGGLSEEFNQFAVDVRVLIGPFALCENGPAPCAPLDGCPVWGPVIGDIPAPPPPGTPLPPGDADPTTPVVCPGQCQNVSGVCVRRVTLQLACGSIPLNIPCDSLTPGGTTVRIAGSNYCVKPQSQGSSTYVLCDPLQGSGLCNLLFPSGPGPSPVPFLAPPDNMNPEAQFKGGCCG